MRNIVPIVVLFLASPTAAQVSSGTIVVINTLKDRIIVAADSRGIDENTGAQMVEQSGEAFLLPFSCRFAHTEQSLGHAFPTLCRAHA